MKRFLGILFMALVMMSILASCEHQHEFSEWKTVKEPTCTEQGIEERVCSCGEKETRTLGAVGHSFGEWKIKQEPGCTYVGLEERTCSCGEKQTRTVEPTGHVFGEWVVIKEATCTEDGEQERICKCGHKEAEVIPAGHKYGEWTVVKEATCTEDGLKERVCACNEKESKVIPAIGHNRSEWILNEEGTEAYVMCSNCEQVVQTTAEMYFSAGLEIKDNTVVGIGSCTDLNIVIPVFQDGKIIERIDNNAFNSCTTIAKITMYDNIKTIGERAFYNCESLTEIVIPDSILRIGGYAFYDCDSLIKVNITDIAAWCNIDFANRSSNPIYYAGSLCVDGTSVTELIIPESVTRIKKYAFCGYNMLKKLTVGQNVSVIEEGAFMRCENLVFATLSDDVKTIENQAFYGCTNLTSLTIGGGLRSVGEGAFENCFKLIEVVNNSKYLNLYVDDKNNGLISFYAKDIHAGESKLDNVDGYLFYTVEHKDEEGNPYEISYLVNYIGIKTDVILPDLYNGNEYVLFGYAFYDNDSITKIKIADSIKIIDKSSFRSCDNLKEVDLGDGVGSIGEYAFAYCVKLSNVIFGDELKELGNYSFLGCSTLSEIVVSDNVETVGKYAFAETGLTKVNLGNGVTKVSAGAFALCDNLSTVIIGSAVEIIESDAFAGCDALNKIYYTSSENDWLKISIAPYNSEITGATISFNYVP